MALTRRLTVGLSLIILAIALLLWSDPKRVGAKKTGKSLTSIAVLNYASNSVLEEGLQGLLAGLEDAGFKHDESCRIKQFNAEGDQSTAAIIAKEIVGDNYDLVITLSTPTLQALATANTTAKLNHVFTLSTDPWGAGVGISREDPSQHPDYMTGYGSLQPVEALFKLALVSNPNLKKVGVVWNPSESNSEASTLAARAACSKLGIELSEATVDTSSGVVDAAKALISRNVEAIWAGGDSTVSAARDSMFATAANAGIPVFTNMPTDAEAGAIFCLGADYREVGYAGGQLGARVLKGESPKNFPVENFVPEKFSLNLKSFALYSDNWKVGSDWEKSAAWIIERDGKILKKVSSPSAKATDDSLPIPSAKSDS